MTSLIQDEFSIRQEDIDLFIELIKSLDDAKEANYSPDFLDKSDNFKEVEVNQRLIDVMKSALYLLAYNQTESTLRDCLAQVYDDISDNEISYDELQPKIQETVIKGLLKKYKDGGQSLANSIEGKLSLNSPKLSLDIKKVFNGNVETKTIHELKNIYGITVIANADNRDGKDITTLKKARNDLAHGNESFSHYSSNKELSDVINEVNRSSKYLSAVIDGFEQYIIEKKYKL
ncbi:hypothetical protein QXB69_002571 [Vibrio fluvialis]|nr:hypothetical protein [Vibrio fluvialis]ELO1774503.1 hypothetical protein [Vibrio fluvialis]